MRRRSSWRSKKVPEVCRTLGVSEQSYYRWRNEYGGLKAKAPGRSPALELAAAECLIMAAISRVYTVGGVAEMLGEDEDWLDEISIEIPPEEGRLSVWQADGSSVTAFTEFGIENLRYVIQAHDECPDLESRRPSERR